MVFGLVVVAMFVVGIIVWRVSDDIEPAAPFYVLGAVFGAAFLFWMAISTGLSMNADVDQDRCVADIAVLQERYMAQEATVLAQVKRYPLEEGLLRDLKPGVLLSLPQIKSDAVISDMLTKLLSIQDDLYNKRLELNKVRRDVLLYRKWFFIPTLYRPTLAPEETP